MDPYASVHLAWSIIFYTCVIVGLGCLAACVAIVAVRQVEKRNRRRSAAVADRIAPYARGFDASWLDEFEASLKAHREASEGRQKR